MQARSLAKAVVRIILLVNKMSKTILVTGGAGFIGSAVVRHLISDTDHTVVNLDKLTYAGNLESLTSISK